MSERTQDVLLPGSVPRSARFTSWIAGVVAVFLMALAIWQTLRIAALERDLASARAEVAALKKSNALDGFRLTAMGAKDLAYGTARLIVAWDPNLNRGVLSLQNLPAPPAGRDYQLWVLDPRAEAPLNAGIVPPGVLSRQFTVPSVRAAAPGFAVSLEPAGGQPTPGGPILFAVEPEQ